MVNRRGQPASGQTNAVTLSERFCNCQETTALLGRFQRQSEAFCLTADHET